ncbi:MAG: TMEM175 family protein [Methanobacterium sp.]
MTLLILSIGLPNASFSSVLDFRAYVLQLIPQILIYFISFILLAISWLNHHLLFAIKKANLALMWINIIWLMFIALVPLPHNLSLNLDSIHFPKLFSPSIYLS